MTVDEVVRSEVARHGLLLAPKVEKREGTPCFDACANLQTHEITIKHDPSFQSRAKRLLKRKNVAHALETGSRDVTGHECGHLPNALTQGCPGSVERDDLFFLDPITKILQKTHKEGLANDLSNVATDLIVNTRNAQGPHAGLTIVYDDIARAKKMDPAYEAFVRIQAAVWGDKEDRACLRHHYSNDKKIITATQQFLKSLEGMLGARRPSREAFAQYASVSEHWTPIAEALTRALEPLLTPQTKFPQCGFGDAMTQARKDPSNREKIARGRYTSGKGRPSWMLDEEALDALYSSLAREITILADAPRKSQALPFIPYQHRPYDPDEHELEEIDFSKVRVVPEAETAFGLPAITFGVPTSHLDLPILVRKSITSFPSFKVGYIDASGTMTCGLPNPHDPGSKTFIPWGDKSRYHYLCRAYYGILEYLSRAGILGAIEVSLGSFSDSSRTAHGLPEAKRVLFSPEFGGTTMSIDAVTELLGNERGVLFTMSDGEVDNWSSIEGTFVPLAREHQYFHLQLGPETAMTKSLRKHGLLVVPVRSGEDLERLAVDLTRQAYETYVQRTMEEER